jgi:cytochrome c553
MKKTLISTAIFAVLVLVLGFFGPELLDLYRLQRHVETSAAAYQANGGPWPQLADSCIGCHGTNGNSQHQGYPSLAGQPPAYIAAQLHNFSSGQRNSPTMGPLAMSLSDAEIKAVADHFSRQAVSENRWFEADAGLREKGRQLVAAQNCAACHGNNMMGRDQFPRLAGQGYDYLLAQFDTFASGRRIDPTGMMKTISSATSADDLKAMATYLASLAPEKPQTSPKDRQE